MTTPKLTPILPAIMEIVEQFKNTIKTQHDLSEQITTDDCFKDMKQISEKVIQIVAEIEKTNVSVQKTFTESKRLKEESRQSLRSGEMTQRLKESPAYSYEYTVLLNYLHSVAASYERQLLAYAEYIVFLEGLISGKHDHSMSLTDILTHLKRIDELFKHIAAKVYKVHEYIKDIKEVFLHYRRTVCNDKSSYFVDDNPTALKNVLPPTNRLEGPSPFGEASTGALLAMATALTRNQTTAGFMPPPSMFNAQPNLSGSLFQPFGNSFAQPKPADSTSLFRSFAPTTTTNITTAPQFSNFSFSSPTATTTTGSGFGTSTMPSISSTNTTTAPAWNRFSNPINTASTGVLFGGSATQPQNVNVVRPLGLAAPLQQTDASTTLSMLKTTLGVKRGKT